MDHSEGSIWWIVDGYSMDSIDQGNLVDTWWIIDHWWIVSPTGTGRHTGFHTARDPLVIELAIHPPTNLVDWWIVDGSSEGSAWWMWIIHQNPIQFWRTRYPYRV